MKYIFIALFLIVSIKCIYAHEIAITFDDLPGCKDESAEKQYDINERILKGLKKFNAPAIGFVNEGQLYSKNQTKEKIAILKLWIDQHYPLGNHTYAHYSLSASDLDTFQKDVIKGSKVSKKLMQDAGFKYEYFRHSYLDTGSTPEIRSSFESFLKKENYKVAPVTIIIDDCYFNQQLIENPKNKEHIIQKYLEHVRVKLAFYEAASIKIFDRNIKHILLLHVNLINAYVIEDLLKLMRDFNYTFISLDNALLDKAYVELDNYYAPIGASWLYRWDFSKRKIVDWSKEPNPDHHTIKTKAYDLLDKTRNRLIPVELYVSDDTKRKIKAQNSKIPVVVLNHGYGVTNKDYQFIANNLSKLGFFVVSIQHDLKTDPKIPRTGNIFQRRKPMWERGVQNINFVFDELKRIDPNLNLDKVTLIGHSNGGDISMMFADLYPQKTAKIISIDSLRYPFPVKHHLPILSLRATDTKADEGVLPLTGAKIVTIKNAKHNVMYDAATNEVKKDILNEIYDFLR